MQQNGQLLPPGQPSNSPPRNANGMSPPGFPQMMNGAMMGFPSNQNGNVSSPGGGPLTPGQAGSPRMNQQQLANGNSHIIMQLQERIRRENPNSTPEQLRSLMGQEIAKLAPPQIRAPGMLAQSAMNAAAGGNGNTNTQSLSPAQYAAHLRQQQGQQQKSAQAVAAGHQRTPSTGNGAK